MDDQNDVQELKDKIAELEAEVSQLRKVGMPRGIRKRSTTTLCGLPLYEVAVGPDPEMGELRGHAKAIFAVGDIATGVFAAGGLARGVFAAGGAAFGILLGVGGVGVGAVAVGGAALGLLAVGGGAVGLVAIGGGAVGYYAVGGGAGGKFVLDGLRQDPQAIQFFEQWVPNWDQLFKGANQG